MALAVSRRHHTADARVPHWLVHGSCELDDEEMGNTFVRVLKPNPVGNIPPMPHTHLHAFHGLILSVSSHQCPIFIFMLFTALPYQYHSTNAPYRSSCFSRPYPIVINPSMHYIHLHAIHGLTLSVTFHQ
jgi:hypothetical protein